jgi:hypothetical protein
MERRGKTGNAEDLLYRFCHAYGLSPDDWDIYPGEEHRRQCGLTQYRTVGKHAEEYVRDCIVIAGSIDGAQVMLWPLDANVGKAIIRDKEEVHGIDPALECDHLRKRMERMKKQNEVLRSGIRCWRTMFYAVLFLGGGAILCAGSLPAIQRAWRPPSPTASTNSTGEIMPKGK